MNATDTTAASTTRATANVTLEIYSGRPDPTWSLDDASIQALRERLAVLHTTEPDTPTPDGLGYRGLRVAMTGQNMPNLVTVSRGVVTVERGAEKRRFVDAGREMEMWLVKGGENALTPTLFKQVTDKISAAPR